MPDPHAAKAASRLPTLSCTMAPLKAPKAPPVKGGVEKEPGRLGGKRTIEDTSGGLGGGRKEGWR